MKASVLLIEWMAWLRAARKGDLAIHMSTRPIIKTLDKYPDLDIGDERAKDMIIETLRLKLNGDPVCTASLKTYVHCWCGFLKRIRKLKPRQPEALAAQYLRDELIGYIDGFTDDDPVEIKALTLEEMDRLYRAAENGRIKELRPLNLATLKVMYGTAARCMEVVQFTVPGIEWFGGGQYKVKGVRRKRNSHMPIYLYEGYKPYWVDACSRVARLHGGDRERQLYGMVRRVGERAGLEVSPHVIRRTRATHLLKAGKSMEVIQKVLGHAAITTTQKYLGTRASEEMVCEHNTV